LPLQAVLVHGAVRVEEVDEGEVVPLPHLPVVGVVGGGHFDDPRPEFLGRGKSVLAYIATKITDYNCATSRFDTKIVMNMKKLQLKH